MGRRLLDGLTAEMPTILGMRDIADPYGPFPFIAWPVAVIWIACLAIYMVRGLRRRDVQMGAVFLLCVPVIVALSGFRSFALHPRYLSPCYSILPLALGTVAIWAWSRWRPVVMGSLALVIVLHVWGNSRLWETGLLWEKWRPESRWVPRDRDHEEILRVLDEKGVRHVFTNYWIGYRLHLESKGRVIPSPFLMHTGPELPCEERYPPFTREVRSQGTSNYLLWKDQADAWNRIVAEVGEARRTFVGPFVLYTGIPAPRTGNLVDPSDLELRLPEGFPEGGGTLIDGDHETIWQSRCPQESGMALVVTLPEAISLTGIDVAFRILPFEPTGAGRVPVPRGLRILTSQDGETFQAQVPDVPPLVNRNPIRAVPYRLIVPLPGSMVRAVRLEITDPCPWAFEMAEIHLLGPPPVGSVK